MEISWDFLQKNIYNDKDICLDIYILDVTKENWIQWAEYINDNYELKFYNYQTDAHEDRISLSVLVDYWNNRNEDSEIYIGIAIELGAILIESNFVDDTQIENYFYPGDVKNLDDHYKLISYLSDISTLLSKPVILTPENMPDFALIIVTSNDVKIKVY